MPYQKYLGLILYEKLNFKKHIDSANSKVNKGISLIKKFRNSLLRKSLIVIYTIKRHLIDFGDIIYEKPQNDSFSEKLGSMQYKAA